MIYIDIENCGMHKYAALLSYVFQECNKVTFHLPNFLNKGDLNIKLDDNGNVNCEYVNYLAKNNLLVMACLHQGGKKTISKIYNGVKLAYNTQIISSNIVKEVKDTLTKHHIYDWVFPDLPEDLCFFRDECCRFVSETHENSFYIVNVKDRDRVFLRDQGFRYLEHREDM